MAAYPPSTPGLPAKLLYCQQVRVLVIGSGPSHAWIRASQREWGGVVLPASVPLCSQSRWVVCSELPLALHTYSLTYIHRMRNHKPGRAPGASRTQDETNETKDGPLRTPPSSSGRLPSATLPPHFVSSPLVWCRWCCAAQKQSHFTPAFLLQYTK